VPARSGRGRLLASMSITSEQFRRVLRLFPCGVTITTLRCADEIHGLTVSAFASVSPEPPLIAVVIDNRHRAAELLEQPGTSFAVNFLAEDQAELSNRFAWVKDEDRFAEVAWGQAATGAPVLENALAWLDCHIHSSHRAGDHTIYVGEVQACRVLQDDKLPLVYWNQGYRKLDTPS